VYEFRERRCSRFKISKGQTFRGQELIIKNNPTVFSLTERRVKMMKSFFAILTLFVFLFSLGMVSKATAQDRPWVLGVTVPLTGAYADEAEDQVRAATLAVEEINAAGGILGRKIKMVVEDTRLKPDIAVQKARKLIEKDGVHVIVGEVSSGNTVAMAAETQKANVFHMGMAGSDDATGKNCHRHFFTVDPSAHQMAYGTMSVFLDEIKGPKKWVFITSDYTWGHTSYNGAIRALKERNATEVGNILSPLACPDYTPYLTKAMQSGAEVLGGIVYGGDQQKLLTQANEFGLKKKMQIVMIVGCQSANWASGPDVMEGIYAGLPWDWNIPYPHAKELGEKCLKRFGSPPAWSASQVYASIIVAFDVIRRTGNPPEKFNADLCVWLTEGLKYKVTKGWEQFRECDHRAIQEFFVGVGKNKKEMKNKFDMFKIVGHVTGPKLMLTCPETQCKLEPYTNLDKKTIWIEQ
jgi:branched-chain amino acid transport system substrate-binding protein